MQIQYKHKQLFDIINIFGGEQVLTLFDCYITVIFYTIALRLFRVILMLTVTFLKLCPLIGGVRYLEVSVKTGYAVYVYYTYVYVYTV